MAESEPNIIKEIETQTISQQIPVKQSIAKKRSIFHEIKDTIKSVIFIF